MKKSFFLIHLTVTVAVSLFSLSAFADGDGEGHRGNNHHYQSDERRYYPQQPQYQRYQDPRSTQGLAVGVVGSVLGYQLGNGNPVAAGVGAAAGSYLGNGMSGR